MVFGRPFGHVQWQEGNIWYGKSWWGNVRLCTSLADGRVGVYEPYGDVIARQTWVSEAWCLKVACALAWGVLVFAVIGRLRSSSLHFIATAQRCPGPAAGDWLEPRRMPIPV
jgi:hypothetical protein